MNSPTVKVSLWILLVLILAAPAVASQVSVVSRVDPGLIGDSAGGSLDPYTDDAFGRRVSADGRYVVFVSTSTRLVPGQVDANGQGDIFLRDRVTGTTVLVSRSAASGTTAANTGSGNPVLSADGRWVAFSSGATDLVQGQTDVQNDQMTGNSDVFLFDRVAATVRLVSHAAGSPATAGNRGSAFGLTISADGAYLAFVSHASDLVSGQNGPWYDQVFLYERATDTNRLVSHAAGSPTTGSMWYSSQPRLSADGRYVAYTSSSTDLMAGASVSTALNVYLYDRIADTNVLVSHAAASPITGGNHSSSDPRVSADGRYVAFESTATDLVAGFTSPDTSELSPDVFLWDRDTGAVTLVSHTAASATTGGNGLTYLADIDDGGGWVLFKSWSTNLVTGQTDTNLEADIFLFERVTGAITLVSHVPGSATTTAFGDAFDASISGDGRYVVFMSDAHNQLAGPTETGPFDHDLFLFDRTTGAVTLVSHAAGSAGTPADLASGDPEISSDGGTVVFESSATNLASGSRDDNGLQDVYAHDRVSGAADLVSWRTSDRPSLVGNFGSLYGVPSHDGRWVTFASESTDLVPGQADANGERDVFLHDRLTGAMVLVSRKAGATPGTTPGFGSSGDPAISGDGRYVAFSSDGKDLVAGQTDTDNLGDIFLFDRDTGAVTLVSHASGSPTTADNGSSGWASISADGRRVSFSSRATNLVAGQTDTNGHIDIFLFDRDTGTVTLVSHASGSPGTAGNGYCGSSWLSADGNFLVFECTSTNLVAGQTDTNGATDTNSAMDVFLYDIATGATSLVSHVPGSSTTTGNGLSDWPSLSADGAYIVFQSASTDLVAGQSDVNTGKDAFLFERATGLVTLVSHARTSATAAGNSPSSDPRVSSDGAWIAFTSQASDLAAGQSGWSSDQGADVFLQERSTGTTVLVSHIPHMHHADAGGSLLHGISGDGRYVVYTGQASDLVSGVPDPGWAADGSAVLLYDRDVRESALVTRSLASPLQRAAGGSVHLAMPSISQDGGTVVFTSSSSDLVPNDYNNNLDIFAYDNGRIGSFYTIAPCRVLDTRQSQDGPALVSGQTSILHIHGACGIPETAKAVAANVTVVQPSGMGYLICYRGDLPGAPVTSTINFNAGQVRANNTIVRLSANADGTLRVHPVILGGGAVHVLVDLFGYFE